MTDRWVDKYRIMHLLTYIGHHYPLPDEDADAVRGMVSLGLAVEYGEAGSATYGLCEDGWELLRLLQTAEKVKDTIGYAQKLEAELRKGSMDGGGMIFGGSD